MSTPFVIPAQIRAGRAFLDWSQEELAKAAEVGLSSVRDTESQKRSADSVVANAIRQALENAGIIFVHGDENGGPGVRLAANRPNVIRRPTVVTKWDGVPFDIEWQGKPVTVFVSNEVLEDLERLTNPSDEQLLRSFDRHSGRILDAVVRAIAEPGNLDERGRLRIRSKDLWTKT